jgi:hypothetical protein
MSLSSYDRIGESFILSSNWKQLAEKFRANIAQGPRIRYRFSNFRDHNRDYDYEIVPRFIIMFGTNEFERSLDISEPCTDFTFPISRVLPDDELNEIVESLFGTKGYPTFNCKEEKARKKWPDFARTRLMQAFKAELDEYTRNVSSQIIQIAGTDEFIAKKKRAYELLVIKDIKEVVLKFHDKVGAEVLKEALDEVVTHAIMEG